MQTVDESSAMPMPQYQCHKKVWALKVLRAEIGRGADSQFVFLHFEDERYAPRTVTAAFANKHLASGPCAGWYFVVYEDGYESMSPPEAFESGYTLIEPA